MTTDMATAPLEHPSIGARLLVCEQSGAWSAALRRQMRGIEVSLHESRGPKQCLEQLHRAPASLVALELTQERLGDVLEFLTALERDFPLAAAVVLARRGLEACEEIVREAGAICFVASPRRLPAVMATVRRHFERYPARYDAGAEAIWATLPWGPTGPANEKGQDIFEKEAGGDG